jgi:hypothetical protein
MKLSKATLVVLATAMCFQDDGAMNLQGSSSSEHSKLLLNKISLYGELQELIGTVNRPLTASRNLHQLNPEETSFQDVCKVINLGMAKNDEEAVQCSCDQEGLSVVCQVDGAGLEECLDELVVSNYDDHCPASIAITANFSSIVSSSADSPPLLYLIKSFQLCVNYDSSHFDDEITLRNGCVTFGYNDTDTVASGTPVECTLEFSKDEGMTNATDVWHPFATNNTLVECNSCRVCGAYEFMIDCSNIHEGAVTTGCQVWDTPEKDFFLHFNIQQEATSGNYTNTTDVVTTSGASGTGWTTTLRGIAVGLFLSAI